jgi:glucose/arabinose dehydrogenase
MIKINTKCITIPLTITTLLFSASACSDPSTNPATNNSPSANTSLNAQQQANKPNFTTTTITSFDEPWALTALPKDVNNNDVALKLLITQKTGELLVVDTITGTKTKVSGVPKVAYGGQGGLGDVILAPDFVTSNKIYLSYVEAGVDNENNKFGAKVISAQLIGLDSVTPSLQALTPIWQQSPKVKGQGHYSQRLLFSPDGKYLYISSGERQQKDPAQDLSVNLGKIVRLHPNGSVPADNPFADDAHDVTKQLWTLGNRNVLGMSFDKTGRLWAHEMGPRGGDEFNLIEKGNNYGWPIVSNGRNYSGIDIPDHDSRPDFTAPKITWTPVISPSSMSIYTSGSHNDFPAWQDKVLISGLSSKALIVVDLDSSDGAAVAVERYRYDMGQRMRSVLAVDGEVFLLEDGNGARLLHLRP